MLTNGIVVQLKLFFRDANNTLQYFGDVKGRVDGDAVVSGDHQTYILLYQAARVEMTDKKMFDDTPIVNVEL